MYKYICNKFLKSFKSTCARLHGFESSSSPSSSSSSSFHRAEEGGLQPFCVQEANRTTNERHLCRIFGLNACVCCCCFTWIIEFPQCHAHNAYYYIHVQCTNSQMCLLSYLPIFESNYYLAKFQWENVSFLSLSHFTLSLSLASFCLSLSSNGISMQIFQALSVICYPGRHSFRIHKTPFNVNLFTWICDKTTNKFSCSIFIYKSNGNVPFSK